jgi:hypothetical protein
MRRLLVLCLLAPAYSLAQQQQDFLVTDKEAWLLLPAKAIGANQVREATWSPTGRHVLTVSWDLQLSPPDMALAIAGDPVAAAKAKPVHRLSVWNARSERTVEVLRLPLDDHTQVGQATWLGNSDSALLPVQVYVQRPDSYEPTAMIYQINAGTNQARPVHQELLRGAHGVQVAGSPTRPLAVISSVHLDSTQRQRTSRTIATLVDVAGAVLGRVELPSEGSPPIWAKDGSAAYVIGPMGPTASSSPQVPLMRLDFATGKAVPVPGMTREQVSKLFFEIDENPIKLNTRPLDLKEGTVETLWIETSEKTERPAALVSGDSGWGMISPTNDAVLYISQQVALVRPIVRLPKQVYLQHREAAERTEVMSRAKQLGTAMAIFSMDNEGELPAAGADMERLLQPYLKNTSLFQGFVYTFPGGILEDVKDPSKTELGYVVGPGGRAVIYADSSVRWQSDKP